MRRSLRADTIRRIVKNSKAHQLTTIGVYYYRYNCQLQTIQRCEAADFEAAWSDPECRQYNGWKNIHYINPDLLRSFRLLELSQ